jgi:hypothetical protein
VSNSHNNIVCGQCGHDHISYGEFTPNFCLEVEGFGTNDEPRDECECPEYKDPMTLDEYLRTHPLTSNNLRRYMDFGDVVLENRPIIICQCKYDLCVTCNGVVDSPEHDIGAKSEDMPYAHQFYQRSKIWGPRVVIDQYTKTGKCNDCGRKYEVNVFAHSEVVPY